MGCFVSTGNPDNFGKRQGRYLIHAAACDVRKDHLRCGDRPSKYEGFSWPAFFFGPFWYFAKGMAAMGILMLFLGPLTAFLGWMACGFFANRQYRERLASRGYRLA